MSLLFTRWKRLARPFSRSRLVVAPGAGTITSFRVRFNGTLDTADAIGGLPASAAGLVAR